MACCCPDRPVPHYSLPSPRHPLLVTGFSFTVLTLLHGPRFTTWPFCSVLVTRAPRVSTQVLFQPVGSSGAWPSSLRAPSGPLSPSISEGNWAEIRLEGPGAANRHPYVVLWMWQSHLDGIRFQSFKDDCLVAIQAPPPVPSRHQEIRPAGGEGVSGL